MSGIQFILGRSGTGKTCLCIEQICESLKLPDQTPLLFLVPEQATYQAERAILSKPGIKGFSRLRVVSFERLQYLLGDRTHAGTELSHTAKQMILHKILLEMSGKLKLYRGDLQRTGLAGKFATLLQELQADNCTPRQLELLAESLASKAGQELTSAKWADIAAVFGAYEHFFQSRQEFINPDNVLKNACPQVAASIFKGARLWVDGFSGFSAQEQQLLVELLKVCGSASIALCLDPVKIDTNNDDAGTLDPYSLFASAEETYCGLLKTIRKIKLTVDKPLLLQKTLRFDNAPALAAIENNLVIETEKQSCAANDAIQIAACANIRAEAIFVAESINSLIRTGNMRYRDIAVVLPEMETYPHYIESAFREYGIPYFFDRPRRMKTHPLAQVIGSALQAALGGFKLADILSFLKCGLSPLEADDVDSLETYARAFDIQGNEWLSNAEWHFAPEKESQYYNEPAVDKLRKAAIEPLVKLQTSLTRRPDLTAAEFIEAIWQLLEDINAVEKLKVWALADSSDQQFGHRQVFEKLIELFDLMNDVFGDSRLPANGWTSILTEALGAMTIKFIPPKLDQTLVGSIERSRHPDIKAIFLMGAVQKQFPVPLVTESLLTEKDYLAAASFEVSRPAYLDLTHRPYLSYIALTRPSQRMVLTYPMLDEKGNSVIPWSGIDWLRRCFSDLTITMPKITTSSPQEITTSGQAAQWLSTNLGRDRRKDSDKEIAAGLLECFRKSQDEGIKSIAGHVDNALSYENAAALDGGIAERAFKFPLKMSASRLATFAGCPYKYFAQYVLGLERRQLLGFEAMDIGSFYHLVLQDMFVRMKSAGKTWPDMTDDELRKLCDSVIDKIVTTDTNILNFKRRKAHNACILNWAIETIRSFVPKLAELNRAGAFRQTAAELEFKQDDSSAFVTISGGRKVYLSGRIDRLDAAQVDGQTLGIVFDYKSGPKTADYAKMLYGLDMQLPIYLIAVETTDYTDCTDLKNSNNKIVPVGAFFLHIDGGFESASLSQLGEKAAGGIKANGLFDGRFFESLDSKTECSKFSKYYNFCRTKDGDPYSRYDTQGALKPEDFRAILDFTRQRIGRLVEDMASGRIEIKPYRLSDQSPCAFCDYRALCRFDWQINEYNLLDRFGKEEVLEIIKGD